MCSVQVSVDWISDVCCVEGGGEVVAQSEAVDTFTQAVEVVVGWQNRDKLDELVFVDEDGAHGGEKDITRGLA